MGALRLCNLHVVMQSFHSRAFSCHARCAVRMRRDRVCCIVNVAHRRALAREPW